MKEIPLTKGYVAYVDDCDFERISEHKWYPLVRKNCVYARTCRGVYMHRLILQPPSDMDVDHIDHDGLNNTRSNLRLATVSQNAQNSRLMQNNTSGVKGVYWNKVTEQWCARVYLNKKCYFVGRFDTLEEAKEAIAKKRLELHGEFSYDSI